MSNATTTATAIEARIVRDWAGKLPDQIVLRPGDDPASLGCRSSEPVWEIGEWTISHALGEMRRYWSHPSGLSVCGSGAYVVVGAAILGPDGGVVRRIDHAPTPEDRRRLKADLYALADATPGDSPADRDAADRRAAARRWTDARVMVS